MSERASEELHLLCEDRSLLRGLAGKLCEREWLSERGGNADRPCSGRPDPANAQREPEEGHRFAGSS